MKTLEWKYNLVEKGLTVESVANLLVSSLLEYKGMGLSVGTIVAGCCCCFVLFCFSS